LCGILIGATSRWQGGEAMIRGGGVLIALTGTYFLYLQRGLT